MFCGASSHQKSKTHPQTFNYPKLFLHIFKGKNISISHFRLMSQPTLPPVLVKITWDTWPRLGSKEQDYWVDSGSVPFHLQQCDIYFVLVYSIRSLNTITELIVCHWTNFYPIFQQEHLFVLPSSSFLNWLWLSHQVCQYYLYIIMHSLFPLLLLVENISLLVPVEWIQGSFIDHILVSE